MPGSRASGASSAMTGSPLDLSETSACLDRLAQLVDAPLTAQRAQVVTHCLSLLGVRRWLRDKPRNSAPHLAETAAFVETFVRDSLEPALDGNVFPELLAWARRLKRADTAPAEREALLAAVDAVFPRAMEQQLEEFVDLSEALAGALRSADGARADAAVLSLAAANAGALRALVRDLQAVADAAAPQGLALGHEEAAGASGRDPPSPKRARREADGDSGSDGSEGRPDKRPRLESDEAAAAGAADGDAPDTAAAAAAGQPGEVQLAKVERGVAVAGCKAEAGAGVAGRRDDEDDDGDNDREDKDGEGRAGPPSRARSAASDASGSASAAAGAGSKQGQGQGQSETQQSDHVDSLGLSLSGAGKRKREQLPNPLVIVSPALRRRAVAAMFSVLTAVRRALERKLDRRPLKSARISSASSASVSTGASDRDVVLAPAVTVPQPRAPLQAPQQQEQRVGVKQEPAAPASKPASASLSELLDAVSAEARRANLGASAASAASQDSPGLAARLQEQQLVIRQLQEQLAAVQQQGARQFPTQHVAASQQQLLQQQHAQQQQQILQQRMYQQHQQQQRQQLQLRHLQQQTQQQSRGSGPDGALERLHLQLLQQQRSNQLREAQEPRLQHPQQKQQQQQQQQQISSTVAVNSAGLASLSPELMAQLRASGLAHLMPQANLSAAAQAPWARPASAGPAPAVQLAQPAPRGPSAASAADDAGDSPLRMLVQPSEVAYRCGDGVDALGMVGVGAEVAGDDLAAGEALELVVLRVSDSLPVQGFRHVFGDAARFVMLPMPLASSAGAGSVAAVGRAAGTAGGGGSAASPTAGGGGRVFAHATGSFAGQRVFCRLELDHRTLGGRARAEYRIALRVGNSDVVLSAPLCVSGGLLRGDWLNKEPRRRARVAARAVAYHERLLAAEHAFLARAPVQLHPGMLVPLKEDVARDEAADAAAAAATAQDQDRQQQQQQLSQQQQQLLQLQQQRAGMQPAAAQAGTDALARLLRGGLGSGDSGMDANALLAALRGASTQGAGDMQRMTPLQQQQLLLSMHGPGSAGAGAGLGMNPPAAGGMDPEVALRARLLKAQQAHDRVASYPEGSARRTLAQAHAATLAHAALGARVAPAAAAPPRAPPPPRAAGLVLGEDGPPVPGSTEEALFRCVGLLRAKDAPPAVTADERQLQMFTWNENMALLLCALLQHSSKNPFKTILRNFEFAAHDIGWPAAALPKRPARDRSSLRKRLQKMLHREQLSRDWQQTRRAAATVFANSAARRFSGQDALDAAEVEYLRKPLELVHQLFPGLERGDAGVGMTLADLA